MPEPNPSSFQMHGCRAALLPVAAAFEPQVQAIEDSIQHLPDFAFDLSKTLVESVCRTVLADLGLPADPTWDCPKLLKETTNQLSLLPTGHPNAKQARDSITKTMNGLLNTIHGLCELRNNFGMASHGRDINSARLEQRQAILAAQAADTIAAFLYRTHRDALSQQPANRIYYDDNSQFNDWLDEQYAVVRIGQETLAPSRILFHTAITGYKIALTEFLAAPPDEAGDGGAT